MSPSAWKLDQHLAHLQLGEITAQVNLRDPLRGLHDVRFADQSWDAQLLGVDLQLSSQQDHSLLDAYVRGGDLVATYAQTTDRPLRVQVYWRANESHEPSWQGLAIDLQISVQTDLLGTPPVLTVVSRVPPGDVLRLADPAASQFEPLNHLAAQALPQFPEQGPGCWLVRSANATHTYTEMIHPADFQRVTLKRNDVPINPLELQYQLFAIGDLEKGVILRARLRGMLLARKDDASCAAAGYRQMLEAAPPLTT